MVQRPLSLLPREEDPLDTWRQHGESMETTWKHMALEADRIGVTIIHQPQHRYFSLQSLTP